MPHAALPTYHTYISTLYEVFLKLQKLTAEVKMKSKRYEAKSEMKVENLCIEEALCVEVQRDRYDCGSQKVL